VAAVPRGFFGISSLLFQTPVLVKNKIYSSVKHGLVIILIQPLSLIRLYTYDHVGGWLLVIRVIIILLDYFDRPNGPDDIQKEDNLVAGA
jgi:hypothetical protein